MQKKMNLLKENRFKQAFRYRTAIILFLFLAILTLTTAFKGSTDTADYSHVAKFFSGMYAAKIRSSHSYLYGFVLSPLVKVTENFIFFKIANLFSLVFIIISVFYMSGKNKKALWLILLSPIVWYMAPWINPIQISSLLFLWAYYFFGLYNERGMFRYALYAGIFIGVAWAFWDTMLFFGLLLALIFTNDKKLNHVFGFIFFVIIGLIPRLILDTALFNFPLFTILKSTGGTFLNIFGGIYNYGFFERATTYQDGGIAFLILIVVSLPLYYWGLYRLSVFRKHKKDLIFFSLAILLILTNPQIRYTLVVVPPLILILARHLNHRQFKRQLLFSGAVILFFITPYIIQIHYTIDEQYNGVDIAYILQRGFVFSLEKESPEDKANRDLYEITRKFPNETFVVGPAPDDAQWLAEIYWGRGVNEFVSIQDYKLRIQNKTVIYERRFMPVPNIDERRQIWIAGGININERDETNYQDINLAIGLKEPIHLEDFVVIKKYDILYLSKRTVPN